MNQRADRTAALNAKPLRSAVRQTAAADATTHRISAATLFRLNVVKRFFAKLTKRPLPKRVLLDRVEQPAAIRRFPAKITANCDHSMNKGSGGISPP